MRFIFMSVCAAFVLGPLILPAAPKGYPPGTLAEAARAAGVHAGVAVDHAPSDMQRKIAEREFTSLTLENALKWSPLSSAVGRYDFTRPDLAIDWAEQNGMRVRGHTLFWGRMNGPPPWLEGELAAAEDPAARLTELMRLHASTVVGRYAGRIEQWDVVNEPLSAFGGNHDPQNIFFATLGEPYIDIAFEAAHAADPAAVLFLNETLAELVPVKFDGLMALVERLLARDVPVHGVGLQAHFYTRPPERDTLQAQLERIESLGLYAELTELDLPLSLFKKESDPLAAQARAYGDVFAACLAVPACTGVTVWGVDDGDTWLDNFFLTERQAPNRPLLFDKLGWPKPAYGAVVEAFRAAAQAKR